MHIKRCFITLMLSLFAVNMVHSQDVVTTDVHFRFDKYDLILDYMGNSIALEKLAHQIDSIGISNIDSIVIVSQSSPEGVYEYNLALIRKRAETMHKYMLNSYPELSDRIFVNQEGESWAQLREHVENDTLMKNATKEKVISIIDGNDDVRIKKQRMTQLPVYRYLLRTYYPKIRNSVFNIVYHSGIMSTNDSESESKTPETDPKLDVAEVLPDTCTTVDTFAPEAEEWTRKLYLKTNVIGWGMAMVNIGAEVDLTKHWSFTLPVYYSAWDYFKPTVKFRTFAVQPEFRYWLSEKNNGFYTGAHIGLAYYNFAFDGKFRYQDHLGETPAIGGGVSIGYRLPISNQNRWQLEFSLGAGVYPIHFDKFHNTPNYKNGLMTESIKKTYWGIDQLAVSLAYSFGQKRKGNK